MVAIVESDLETLVRLNLPIGAMIKEYISWSGWKKARYYQKAKLPGKQNNLTCAALQVSDAGY